MTELIRTINANAGALGMTAVEQTKAKTAFPTPAVLLVAPALIFIILFFVGPLILNLQQSLQSHAVYPSAAQYQKFLTDGYYLLVLLETIIFGVVVTLLCVLFGYPFAYAFSHASGPWKSFLLFVIVAPLVTNAVVRSYGWMIILGGTGLINSIITSLGFGPVDIMYSWTSVTIAMAHVLLPFMILSISSVLEGHNRTLDEAAATLGASPRQIFFRIVFPLSFEGVITGCILVFTLSIGSFVTVLLLGNTRTMVVAVLIYQQLSVASNWGFGAAMGMILLVIVMASLWLQQRLRSGWVA